MSTITRSLCLAAREGDREAFDRLFALHTDRVRLYIRARLGARLRSKLESGDVLQEAYLAAFRDFDGFEYRDEGSFLCWLLRICDHRIRDQADRYGAAKRQTAALPRRDRTGPVTALVRVEHREQLARAMAGLSEDHRTVLLHRYFEGLSAEETGVRMDRSAGAVRKLCARALVALGEALRLQESAP